MAFKKKSSRGRRGGRRLGAVSTATMIKNGVAAALPYARTALNAAYTASELTGAVKQMKKAFQPKANKPRYANRPMKSARAINDSGYIPSHSRVIGNRKTSLSYRDKINQIVNPAQTFCWSTSGKIESVSGLQGHAGFVVDNSYLNEVMTRYAALRSETTVVSPINDGTFSYTKGLHSITSVLHTFMNSGTTVCELDVYSYVAAQDIASATNFSTPVATWQYGESINVLLGQPATEATNGVNNLGKAPSNVSIAPIMGRYWRVIDKWSCVMKPGESVKHYIRTHINKTFASGMVSDTLGALKGHALGYIFVCRGQVVGSSLNASVANSDSQISFTRVVKVGFNTLVLSRPRDVTIAALTGIAAANQVFINEDTGAQQTGYGEDP